MGGIMKGGHTHGHMHAAYSYSRRRWANVYVVVVIMCSLIGCGILGLMGLHRLKERRSLNLLIKEKDDQILSLHLLLQKEKEHIVEVKRKTEELKMKIMNLGSEKAELNSRISDMQSTIFTLKEEQRAVELAFEEKHNEAKLSREKYIQAKEDEIADLKHRLQLHGAEVGGVSDNQRLILPSNATAEANTAGAESMIHENGGLDVQDGKGNNAADASRDGKTESSMTRKEEIDGSFENGGTNADRASEEVEPEFSTDQEREGRKRKAYENGNIIADLGQQVQEFPRRSKSQSSDNQEVEVPGGTNADRTSEEVEPKFSTDQEREGRERKGYENGNIADLGHHVPEIPRRSKSRSSDNQEVEVHGGKMKMEIQENSHRFRGKRAYLRRTKGKRWGSVVKQTEGKRTSLSNVASTMANEDRSVGNELGYSLRKEDTKDLSSNSLRNSSSEKTYVSLEELAKQSEIKTEDSGSANKDALLQHREDNEQSKEQISVLKPTEIRHEHQHTDLLGREEAAADGVQKRYSEESEMGEDNEEKEETDVQEF